MTTAARAKPAQKTPTAQVIAVAALSLVLISLVALRLRTRGPVASAERSSTTSFSEQVPMDVGEPDLAPLLASLAKPLPELRSSQFGSSDRALERDPFLAAGPFRTCMERKRAASSAPSCIAQPEFVLKAILRDGNGAVAYINDSIVARGDTLDNFTVREITQWQVILEKDDMVLTLRLPILQLLERSR